MITPYLEWNSLRQKILFNKIREENANKYYAKRKIELEESSILYKRLKESSRLNLDKSKLLEILKDSSNSKLYYAEMYMTPDDFAKFKIGAIDLYNKHPLYHTMPDYDYIYGSDGEICKKMESDPEKAREIWIEKDIVNNILITNAARLLRLQGDLND